MIYKILVTTTVTRPEAVAVDTTVIEFEDYSDARLAVSSIRNAPRHPTGGSLTTFTQTAVSLNFRMD
jgi:hypothetical protein